MMLPNKIGWKALFLALMGLNIFITYRVFLNEHINWSFFFVDRTNAVCVLLMLFGYAYNVKLFNRKTWFFIVLFPVGYDIYQFSTADYGAVGEEALLSNIIQLLLFVVPIEALKYWAIYSYLFRSAELWRRD